MTKNLNDKAAAREYQRVHGGSYTAALNAVTANRAPSADTAALDLAALPLLARATHADEPSVTLHQHPDGRVVIVQSGAPILLPSEREVAFASRNRAWREEMLWDYLIDREDDLDEWAVTPVDQPRGEIILKSWEGEGKTRLRKIAVDWDANPHLFAAGPTGGRGTDFLNDIALQARDLGESVYLIAPHRDFVSAWDGVTGVASVSPDVRMEQAIQEIAALLDERTNLAAEALAALPRVRVIVDDLENFVGASSDGEGWATGFLAILKRVHTEGGPLRIHAAVVASTHALALPGNEWHGDVRIAFGHPEGDVIFITGWGKDAQSFGMPPYPVNPQAVRE